MLSAIELARARGGYAWWYVEVNDTQSRYGLTLIMFAGSVFSPHYADRLRRGEAATGLDHPAVNLCLYERAPGSIFSRSRSGPQPTHQRLWVMNEYPASALRADARHLAINRSEIDYFSDGSARIELHEESTYFWGRPGPRVDAILRIGAPAPAPCPIELGRNAAGEVHLWQPLAAAVPAEVELDCGALSIRYRGLCYCDRNYGSGRLEHTFRRWSWAHGTAGESSALVLYRAQRRDGGMTGLRVRYGPPTDAPPDVRRCETTAAKTSLRRDFLWLAVPSRFTIGSAACERLSGGQLQDAPFYARYVARLRDDEKSYLGVGEYLDLDRFRLKAVQKLLTYKIHRHPELP